MAQKMKEDGVEVAHSTKLPPLNSPPENAQPLAVVTLESDSVGNGCKGQKSLELNSSMKSAAAPVIQEPETPYVGTSTVTIAVYTATDGQTVMANETGPSCTTASGTRSSQVHDKQPSVSTAVTGTVAQLSTSTVHGLSAVPDTSTCTSIHGTITPLPGVSSSTAPNIMVPGTSTCTSTCIQPVMSNGNVTSTLTTNTQAQQPLSHNQSSCHNKTQGNKILVSQPSSTNSVHVCASGLNVLLNKQVQNTSQLVLSKQQVSSQSAAEISKAIPGLTKLPLTSPASITGALTVPLQMTEQTVQKLPTNNKTGSKVTCTVTGISPQSAVSPPSVVVPDFLPGRVNAKAFPPRHYNFNSLEIGSWKYTSKASDFLCTTRIKTVFSQRKLVYEFQLTTDSLRDTILGMKRMACIEVPFHTIQGINISAKNDVLLEVNFPPAMYLGSQELHSGRFGQNQKVKYDTKTTVDITGEQLSTIPYHKISSVRGLKNRLREFDPRFVALLQIPIVVDTNKRLSSIRPTPIEKPRKQRSSGMENVGPSSKKKRSGPTFSTASCGTAKGVPSCCSCTTGCKSKRCACSKIPAKCSQSCKCVDCSNPLNILEEIGIDVNAAKRDYCFMQNAVKTENLRELLQGSVSTPCCEEEISLKDCVVGVVECPEEDCGAEYRYSWCGNDLCDDENRPRYHCPICKCCGDHRDQHCERCNKCYFAGSMGSFECPCRERKTGGSFGLSGLAALWNMF